MRDLDDFRAALATETAGLRVDLSTDRIRRRARRIRAGRTALVAAGLVLALAVPAGVLAATIDRRRPDTGPTAPVCTTPGADGTVPWIGAPIEILSGAPIKYLEPHQVFVGAVDTVDRPLLALVYHHDAPDIDEYGVVKALTRTPTGGFRIGDPDSGPEVRLVSLRVNYGNVLTLDLGLYAGLADRVTITSNGTTIEAQTVANRETGWTFFWSHQEVVAGDAPVTLTAYDDDRAVASAPGESGPGVWNSPADIPGPPVTFPARCSR